MSKSSIKIINATLDLISANTAIDVRTKAGILFKILTDVHVSCTRDFVSSDTITPVYFNDLQLEDLVNRLIETSAADPLKPHGDSVITPLVIVSRLLASELTLIQRISKDLNYGDPSSISVVALAHEEMAQEDPSETYIRWYLRGAIYQFSGCVASYALKQLLKIKEKTSLPI